MKRGITEVSTCELCNQGNETTIHVLRDSKFAKNFWMGLGNLRCDERFFELGIFPWLKRTCILDKRPRKTPFLGIFSLLLVFEVFGTIKLEGFSSGLNLIPGLLWR